MDTVRILLAEDNAAHRRLLLLSLVEAYPLVEVVFATTREAVIEAATTRAFDCIVLDFNLPCATASEILVDIAGAQPDVPRIVISSSVEQHVVIESLRHGVADFLPKHEAITGSVLWDHVRAAITRARRERSQRRTLNCRLRRLEHEAATDPLTGLPNRRAAEAALSSPTPDDRRVSLGVAFLDLDRFKSINDRHGHDVGDAALRRVAEIIRSHALRGDLCCRWGGEEFVVIREVASLPEFRAWADDLRSAVEAHAASGLVDGSITVSIGVDIIRRGSFPPGGVCGADHAMYTAKALGRNRVCTPAMTRAHELSSALAGDPGLTPRGRLLGLLSGLGPDLGLTQLEHTGSHGRSVRVLAGRLGAALGLARESADRVALAAEFHDIGKVGVPEDVLAAPRGLSGPERRFVNEHAPFGADLLSLCGADVGASEAVREHHRRYQDRTSAGAAEGGPPGIASILCVCDAYATMLERRPYAPARSRWQALAELRAHRGSQFHPGVVDALCAMEQGAAMAA